MDKLVNSYFQWLKDNTLTREINGYFEITTPFLDRHNDCIQLYVKELNNDSYFITDDGYTLDDLESSGYSFSTQKRKEYLNNILISYGLKLNGNAIVANANKKDFSYKKHFFIQALTAINDLFITNRSNIMSMFKEDVAAYLDQHRIRYIADINLTGKSGFSHGFDFTIPKSQKAPERYLKVVNNPDKNSAELILFSWEDIRNVRGESKIFVILNDIDNKISSDITLAFESYNIQSIAWSNRNKFIEPLTA